jgi:PAS domain S-box-containing protein
MWFTRFYQGDMVFNILLPYILSLVFSTFVGLYAWKRRQVNGSFAFVFICIFQAIWTFFFLLELTADSLVLKVLYDKIQWIAGFGWVISFFGFSHNYLGIRPHKNLWAVLVSCFLVSTFLVIFDDFHGLLYPTPELLQEEPFSVLDYDFTWLTYIFAGLMYSVYLSGYGPLISRFFRSPRFYRSQILIIMSGALIPLIAATFALADITLGYYRDTAPLSSGISNLIMAIGIFRYGLLDIVPIARHLVLENMLDAVLVVNEDNILVDMNQVAEKNANVSINEVLGKSISEIYKNHPLLQRDYSGAIELEEEVVYERDQRKEYRLVSISPIYDRRDRFCGRLIIIRNINEQKRAQAELEQYAGEIKMLSDEYKSFAYSVSHDLQAPIRAISGFSTMLHEELIDQLDDDSLDVLNRIQQSAARMDDMIKALLTLSRITSNEIKVETIEVDQLAGFVIQNLKEQDPDHNVTCEIQGGLSAEGDPDLIRILLENLLGNAWKYTKQTEKPEITFSASVEGDKTVFCVSDNGIGFDMTRADRLYAPFHRLTDDPNYSGLGIGLATAKKIIQRHGGQIWAESKPDEGARFFFQLN